MTLYFREIFQYDDVTIPQVLSDVDKMEGKDPPQSLPGIYILTTHWYCVEFDLHDYIRP